MSLEKMVVLYAFGIILALLVYTYASAASRSSPYQSKDYPTFRVYSCNHLLFSSYETAYMRGCKNDGY